jgi:hypothetical protein
VVTLDVMQGGYWVLRAPASGEEVVTEGRLAVGIASAGGKGYLVGGVEEGGLLSGEIDVVDGSNMRVSPWRDGQGNPLLLTYPRMNPLVHASPDDLLTILGGSSLDLPFIPILEIFSISDRCKVREVHMRPQLRLNPGTLSLWATESMVHVVNTVEATSDQLFLTKLRRPIQNRKQSQFEVHTLNLQTN